MKHINAHKLRIDEPVKWGYRIDRTPVYHIINHI